MLAIVVVIWLVIGVVAANQRHYFNKGAAETCAKASTIAVTILAGPLNYVGANPKISCHVKVPQPSK